MTYKAQTEHLTAERVRHLFAYDAANGWLVWKEKPHRSSKNGLIGKRAGTAETHGHHVVMLGGSGYQIARLVWLHQKGEWPATRLRAKDGDIANTRIENLELDAVLGQTFEWTPEGRAAYGRAHRAARPMHHKEHDLRKTFGIGVADFMTMHAEQDGKCAICRRPESRMRNGKVRALSVDHCHASGAIRQLLCSDCNTGLGKFGDDIDRLIAAAEYVRSHRAPSNIIPFPSGQDIAAEAATAALAFGT